MDKSQQARKRAEVIMKVNCGLMTAAQAARELNVSRKTYYKWEAKGLSGLMDSVTDQSPGRPEKAPDLATEDLEKKLLEVLKENDILRNRMVLQDIMADLGSTTGNDRRKKK